jgi:transposase-like protein
MNSQVQTESSVIAVGGQRSKPKRRRFTIQDKLQIVEASLASDASVAGIALAHVINANLVFK